MTTAKCFAISLLSIFLLACNENKQVTKESFKKPIEDFIKTQNGACLPPLLREVPYQVAYKSLAQRDALIEAETLVKIGLLTKREVEKRNRYDNDYYEYDLSENGRRLFRTSSKGGRFCTGRQELVSIDNFTEPSDLHGVKVSHVQYTVVVKDLDEWLRINFFEKFPKDSSNKSSFQEQKKNSFILTANGWIEKTTFEN